MLKPCSQSALEVSIDCTPLVFATSIVSWQRQVPTCSHCICNLLPLTTCTFKLISWINHGQSYMVFISLCLSSCYHFLILSIWLTRFLCAIQSVGGFKLFFKNNNILRTHLDPTPSTLWSTSTSQSCFYILLKHMNFQTFWI